MTELAEVLSGKFKDTIKSAIDSSLAIPGKVDNLDKAGQLFQVLAKLGETGSLFISEFRPQEDSVQVEVTDDVTEWLFDSYLKPFVDTLDIPKVPEMAEQALKDSILYPLVRSIITDSFSKWLAKSIGPGEALPE